MGSVLTRSLRQSVSEWFQVPVIPATDDLGKEVFIKLTNGIGIYSGEGADFILSYSFAAGHKVKVCLELLHQNCPPGDSRGKGYSFYDYLNAARITGVDSWHLCGGA